jgi:hypothetical protein
MSGGDRAYRRQQYFHKMVNGPTQHLAQPYLKVVSVRKRMALISL